MSKIIFTPSLFFEYAMCPHWIWHDVFSDPKDKGETPELTQKLIEQGVLHEEEYIKGMNITPVDVEEPARAFVETLNLMRQGADIVYQGSVQAEVGDVLYRGRPDLLEKRNGKSALGDYYYVPIDIKSSKEPNKEQKLQLAFYGIVLEQMQGIFPESAYIINRDRERIYVDIASAKEKMLAVADKIIDILKGNKPALKLTSDCKNSPWLDKCISEAENKKDIALIYRLDVRGHEKLREYGINTIYDMAKMDVNWLEKVPYVPREKLEKAKLQAQALVEKKPIWLTKPKVINNTSLSIYFDMEGDPLLNIDYLIGLWVVGDPEYKYAKIGEVRKFKKENKYFLYFLASRYEDEEKMWRQFLKWVASLSQEEYVVYHYANYEKKHIKTLRDKYGGSRALDNFTVRLVDLFDLTKDAVVLPLYFYGVKDVAKSSFVNYKWRHEKAGGAQSIFWYEKWLETGDKNILDDIIDYNEDDVRATEALHLRLLKEV